MSAVVNTIMSIEREHMRYCLKQIGDHTNCAILNSRVKSDAINSKRCIDLG